MPDDAATPVCSPEAELPAIDIGTFRSLAAVLGQQRMLRMATAFFADAEQRLVQLEKADATSHDLQDHAHALVSMAGHLGLRHLSALCMDLQERARAGGGLDQLPSMRAAVRSAMEAVHAAVAAGRLTGQDTPADTFPNRLSA